MSVKLSMYGSNFFTEIKSECLSQVLSQREVLFMSKVLCPREVLSVSKLCFVLTGWIRCRV